jgi:hypothetical protein
MKINYIKLLFLLSLLAQYSCARNNQSIEGQNQNATDVFPIYLSDEELLAKNTDDLNDCRSHIADAVCLVDPVDYNNPYANQYNRPCLPGGEKYASVFEKHFDQSGPMIQKMYCSLEKIWIENILTTTAYASPIYDSSNNLVAAAIGIKKEFIEKPLSMGNWLSSKEESSFGSKRGLINYTHEQKNKKFNAIIYAINHEFGHIFDYANKINQYDEDCLMDQSPGNCIPKEKSWGAISWASAVKPLAQNTIILSSPLCFYNCQGEFVNSDQAGLLFESLIKTNFQSTYSTINPKEDWAEAFALYLATNEAGLNLKVETTGKTYNLTEHYLSQKLSEKRDFVKKFINSKYLYPGS